MTSNSVKRRLDHLEHAIIRSAAAQIVFTLNKKWTVLDDHAAFNDLQSAISHAYDEMHTNHVEVDDAMFNLNKLGKNRIIYLARFNFLPNTTKQQQKGYKKALKSLQEPSKELLKLIAKYHGKITVKHKIIGKYDEY